MSVAIKEGKTGCAAHSVPGKIGARFGRVNIHHDEANPSVILFLQSTLGAHALKRLTNSSPRQEQPSG